MGAVSAVAAGAPEMALADVEQQLLARWPETRMDPTLDRVAMLLGLLGRPETAYRSIHLTGTNGKTSTARMVEALLAACGSRTGRFTSPHLESMRERISLDLHPIDVDRFVRSYQAVAEQAAVVDCASTHPVSFFEMTVAMAYQAFAAHGVDAAVVEVGMGGRWDATNVITADVAAILPVALDHTDYLGPTVEAIAAEKAGIIKAGAAAVSARQPDDVSAVLCARADAVGAELAVEGRDFAVTRRSPTASGQLLSFRGLHRQYDDVPLALHGEHQAQNAAVAIASAEAFLGGPLDVDLVRTVLGRVASPGRFEIRPGTPPVVLDAAHNPHGARALARNLAEQVSGRTIAVLAVMADKDYSAVLHELEGVVDLVVCTRNSSPRSLPADELAAQATDVFGPSRVHLAADVASGLAAARALADARPGSTDVVLVTGSVVTVGDASSGPTDG
ncbi:folylpolyglutamate synthase/dihydrofolate synthase family protein [Nocardioides sp. HM23]|uniref:bifunctional folylpolyglutamate synthase/dihydrofolate synthase n=1 Tax=Nocardioides bizhenqiangii TaxID=3095076 RepID=UPI002ACA697B|nr:folylpolyglutamate synthase/dihydrofolate synthase family protein [Nocardioides sp. HM23]MDZ5621705.1 folylpolyglutamate synthase/dihydrofolate synthase family protein [Nocardioides sp. HM23]